MRINKKNINKFFRIKINKKQRQKLKNNDFSLITPNCLGGFVLHDLGLKFKTPTINLFFNGLEYFDFLENLEEYLNLDPIPCPYPKLEICSYMYPVMSLNGKNDIEIHFMHYNSYKEARAKWNERKKRLDYKNLFVVVIAGGPWWSEGNQEEILDRFEKLPYQNKVMFVNKPVDEKYKDVFVIKGFEDKPYIGLISDYVGLFGKRYYDQFDFVKWFNERQQERT